MSNGITSTAITPEKAAIVTRFQAMESEGWQALDKMTSAEIAELEEDINNACVHGLSFDHPHNQAISNAAEALRQERIRRDIEMQERQREQQRRTANIHEAASLVSKARDCCLYAAQVERTASYTQPPIEPPDVAAMDDGELSRTLDSYRAELMQIGNTPETESEQSSLIALLKTPEAKAVSRELKADADAHAKRRESLQAAAQAVRDEIERRESEQAAAESEREEIAENLPSIVADLQARITELESEKVG